MADFEFNVTDGPYKGDYEIDLVDLTANEANRFRQAVGVPLAQVVSDGGGDVDVVAGLVWLMCTRGGQARGLPYAAVADAITYGNVSKLTPDAPAAGEGDGSGLDPSAASAAG